MDLQSQLIGYNFPGMLAEIDQVLSNNCFLYKNRPILVGVSGGPDSLFLIHVLAQLGFQCVIAHVNHGLRPEAVEEAAQVRRLADKLDVPFVSTEVDVRAYAQRENCSIEEAARNLRYQFLFSQATAYAAQAVAVGHTADDQVETVLMHLLRGSGLAGLKGMLYRTLPTQWSMEIPLVRPLLGIWRSQVMEYLDEYGYSPSFDSSNQDMDYLRNRLRHVLIPFLEDFNPQVRHNIWRMSEILREDEVVIKGLVDLAWETCLVAQGTGYVIYSYNQLHRQSAGVLRNLFRRGIEHIRPAYRDLDFETLQRALDFIHLPPRTKQIDLANSLQIILEEDQLILAGKGADLPLNNWPQLAVGTTGFLEIPGEFHLSEGWLLRGVIDNPIPGEENEILFNPNPYKAFIDCRGLRLPLIVRGRRPGDRIAPLGMEGHSIKLSDLMINLKMPKRARSGWPLVCGIREKDEEEEILWIPGYRQSHFYRLTRNTPEIFMLQLLKKFDQNSIIY